MLLKNALPSYDQCSYQHAGLVLVITASWTGRNPSPVTLQTLCDIK